MDARALDEHWMRLALAQAREAMAAGEVPVGAVLVHQGRLVAGGRNAPLASHDPTAHAEMAALRAAAQQLGNYRLEDCELFVTLEPCAMCAGAVLQARLKRVVFGAAEPKTGAAGSVIDLFAQARLNHQTRIEGGLLADDCAALLQDFFAHQRAAQRQARAQAGRALREDALRTPEVRFDALPSLPSAYVSALPSLAGLRLHYLDSCPNATGSHACQLLLHGPGDWSLAWRAELSRLAAEGVRVVCPDLVGFGRSDKPKKEAWHTLAQHAQVLIELIEHLALPPLTLVHHPDIAPLAQALAERAPQRIVALSAVAPAPLDDMTREAPYPDRGHRAAQRAFAALLAAPPQTHRQHRKPSR